MSRRGGSARPARAAPPAQREPTPPDYATGACLGAAVGLAAGFAGWALGLRLEGTPFHYGFIGEGSIAVNESVRAAVHGWAVAGAIGMGGGGLLGAMLSRRAHLLAPAVAAATGLYLLALRGWWGYAGLPPNPDGTYPQGIVAPPLPSDSIALPLILAVLGGAGAAFWQGRRKPGVGGLADAAPALGAHLLLSWAAAHLLLQLPLWGSAVEEFVHALPDFLAIF